LYFGAHGWLSLEYKLPASSSWADMVLLGRHGEKPAAVVLELKNWETKGDQPGAIEGLMQRQGVSSQHPSYQVAGYAEYIRQYHSTVLTDSASVHGCVLFTRDEYYHSYSLAPNAALTQEYPCFSTKREGDSDRLLEYFRQRLTLPDRDFAERFEVGTYVQNRGFVAQVGAQLLDATKSPFVLLDNQRFAFAEVNASVQKAIVGKKRPKKTVVIIKGPPGSGKSVVAAKVWAALVTNERLKDGNVVVTTTSTAQKSNWEHLFRQVGGKAAAGVTISANSYTPETTGKFGELRQKHPDAFQGEEHWRENVDMLLSLLGEYRSGSRDNEYLVSIVDEAHALINPEHVDGRGQFGFTTAFGPQAYHIMRASVVSVFFLDEQQGFRDRENTTIEDLKQWASELKIAEVVEVDLSGAQFRSQGSVDFVNWVDASLFNKRPDYEIPSQLQAAEPVVEYRGGTKKDLVPFPPFDFLTFESIEEMEVALRAKHLRGNSVRLLSSYSRPWATKGIAMPHTIDPSDMDFHLFDSKTGRYWSRIWNFTPKNDYSLFVQARVGYPMHSDPLCEVGCPYTVRGFDFDYVGLLWMSDLVIRGGEWVVNPEHIHESGLVRALGRASKERDRNGPMHQVLLNAVKQYYRILMTRSIKGMYVWCEDDETHRWLSESIARSANVR
jgi:hypothetical protein